MTDATPWLCWSWIFLTASAWLNMVGLGWRIPLVAGVVLLAVGVRLVLAPGGDDGKPTNT